MRHWRVGLGPRTERKESWYIRKGLGWGAVGETREDLVENQ